MIGTTNESSITTISCCGVLMNDECGIVRRHGGS